MRIVDVVKAWWVRPSRRELALANVVAGLLDTAKANRRGDLDIARRRLLEADNDFTRYLDEAYPLTKNK